MAFRGREMMKKVLKKVGEKSLGRGVKESLERNIPRSKVVMSRAKRGLYAGRHIQFGNSVSEDGGNKFVFTSFYPFFFVAICCFRLPTIFETLMLLAPSVISGFAISR